MNVDRRAAATICIALLKECAEVGEISESSHDDLVKVLQTMRQQEFWQLRNQSRYEGKNDPTDKQIAICRVALPALDLAIEALEQEDYHMVLSQLELAITTDGSPQAVKKMRKTK